MPPPCEQRLTFHPIQSFFLFFLNIYTQTEKNSQPPDNTTPSASDNMQSDDYWLCAANFAVTEPTLDSTFAPRHLVEPTWPPYRTEAMVSPLLVALCSDYSGTCWATCKPALKGAAHSQTPQFQLSFAIRSIFPCNRSPASKPRGDWARSEGGAVARTARPSDWLPPLAESRPPRLLRLDYGVSGVLMEQAVEMHHHDMTNTQHGVQLSWMRAVCELVKDCKVGPARAKKVIHWRPRDYNRCHGWHRG